MAAVGATGSGMTGADRQTLRAFITDFAADGAVAALFATADGLDAEGRLPEFRVLFHKAFHDRLGLRATDARTPITAAYREHREQLVNAAFTAAAAAHRAAASRSHAAAYTERLVDVGALRSSAETFTNDIATDIITTAQTGAIYQDTDAPMPYRRPRLLSRFGGYHGGAQFALKFRGVEQGFKEAYDVWGPHAAGFDAALCAWAERYWRPETGAWSLEAHLRHLPRALSEALLGLPVSDETVVPVGLRDPRAEAEVPDWSAVDAAAGPDLDAMPYPHEVADTLEAINDLFSTDVAWILELTRTFTASPHVSGLITAADTADDVAPELEEQLRATLHSGLLAANKTEGAAVLADTAIDSPGRILLRRMTDYALAYHRPDLIVPGAATQAPRDLTDVDRMALDAMLDPEGIPYEANIAEAYLRSLLRQTGMGDADEDATVDAVRRYAHSISGVGMFHAPEYAADRRAQFALEIADLRDAVTRRGLHSWPQAFAGEGPEVDRLVDAAFAAAAANYRTRLAGDSGSYQWLNLVFFEAWRIPEAVREPFQAAITRVVHDPDLAAGGVDPARTADAIGDAIAEAFDAHPEWMSESITALLPGHDQFEPALFQVVLEEAISAARDYHHLATGARDLRVSFPWAPTHTLGQMLRMSAAPENRNRDTSTIRAALLEVPGLFFNERRVLEHFAGALAETRPGTALLTAPADTAAARGDRYARAFAALAAAYVARDPLRPSPKPFFHPGQPSRGIEGVLRAVADYGIRHHQANPAAAAATEPEAVEAVEAAPAEPQPATDTAPTAPTDIGEDAFVFTDAERAALANIRLDEADHPVDLEVAEAHLIASLQAATGLSDRDRAAVFTYLTTNAQVWRDDGLIRPGNFLSFRTRLRSDMDEHFNGTGDRRLFRADTDFLGAHLESLAWNYCTARVRAKQMLSHRDRALGALFQKAPDDRVRLRARTLLRTLAITYVDAERQAVAANPNYFTDYRDFAERHLTDALWEWIVDRDDYELGALIGTMSSTPVGRADGPTLLQNFTDTMLAWADAQWRPFDPEQREQSQGRRILPAFVDQLQDLPAEARAIALDLAPRPDWATPPAEAPEQDTAAPAVVAEEPAATTSEESAPAAEQGEPADPAERSWRTSAALQAAAKDALYAQATEPGSPAITPEHEDAVLLGLEFLADAAVLAGLDPETVYHPTDRDARDLIADLARHACTAGPELLSWIEDPDRFEDLRRAIVRHVLDARSTTPAPAEHTTETTGQAAEVQDATESAEDQGEVIGDAAELGAPVFDSDAPAGEAAIPGPAPSWEDFEQAATDAAGNPLDVRTAEAFLAAVLEHTGLDQAAINELRLTIDEFINETFESEYVFYDGAVNETDRYTPFADRINAAIEREFGPEGSPDPEIHQAWHAHRGELVAATFYTASARYRAADCAEHRTTIAGFKYDRLPGEADLPDLAPMLDAIADYIATGIPSRAACSEIAWPATSRRLLDHLRQTLAGTELATFPDLFDPSTQANSQQWENASRRRGAIREWAARYWRPDLGGPAFADVLTSLAIADIRDPRTAPADPAAAIEDADEVIGEAAELGPPVFDPDAPAGEIATAPVPAAAAPLTPEQAQDLLEEALDQTGLPTAERTALGQALETAIDDVAVAGWFNDPDQTDRAALFADHLARLLDTDFDPDSAAADAWRQWQTALTEATFALAGARHRAHACQEAAEQFTIHAGFATNHPRPAGLEHVTAAVGTAIADLHITGEGITDATWPAHYQAIIAAVATALTDYTDPTVPTGLDVKPGLAILPDRMSFAHATSEDEHFRANLFNAAVRLWAERYWRPDHGPSLVDELTMPSDLAASLGSPVTGEPDAGTDPDGPRVAPAPSGPPSGEKARIDANLAAVALLQALDQDGRAATDDERDILGRWSGWGAVPGIFDENRADLAERRERLRALLTEEEYAAARANTLNAHYTDPAYTNAIWDALTDLGFTGGRVLEPGCGSGNFLGAAPAGVDLTGVELDPITARIAAHLHPDARIIAGDFANAPLGRDSFDCAVGNVPFGKFKLYDPAFNPSNHSIHNAFILKTVQLTRPGGIVAVLTSRYTMDSRNPAARRDIATYADLIGAVRLPTGAHQDTAGTKVVTDLLILRRREDGAEPHPDAPAWELSNLSMSAADGGREGLGLGEKFLASGNSAEIYENEYFSRAGSPQHQLGKSKLGAGEAGRPELVIDGPTDPAAVAEGMREALADIAERARDLDLTYTPAPAAAATAKPVAHIPVPIEALNDRQYDGFHLALDDGTFARYLDGVPIEHKVPATEADELRALIALRDTAIRLLDAEAFTAESTPEITSLRRQLNEQYDHYTATWGPLNRVALTEGTYTNKKTGETKPMTTRHRPRQGGFRADPHMGLVYGLEDYNEDTGIAVKLDIFRKRTTGPRPKPTGAETAADALAICLNEHNAVDLGYIAQLLGTDEATARSELGTLVYTDPETDTLVTAGEYCSGDIRFKLAAAREAAALDPAFEVNVAALAEIVPPWLTMTDIEPEFGAAWIPPEDIEQFMREILADPKLQVHYGGGARWDIRGTRRNSVENFEEWGTDARPATDIVERILCRKNLEVRKTVGQGKEKRRVFDPVGTAAVIAKAEALRDAFKAWLRADPARSDRLEAAYNHQFNSLVQRKYDGSHLTFPGQSLAITLQPHQKDAVAQMIAEPSMGLFHEVGLGKTWTMAAGLMEMRRLGLVKKPAIVVPLNMIEQFGREFRELYPRAKLLIAESADLDDRREFLGRCTNGDWDAVIFTKESFQKIAVSEEWQRRFMNGEIDVLTDQINGLRADGNRTVKQAEAARKRAQARLKEQLNWAKDTEIEFEATGIDYIAVDEAHNYKNLGRHSNGELGHKGNKLTADMLMKLTYLRQYYDRVTTFATGTPVTNSIAEVHSYFRYLHPDLLRRHDTEHIDRWSANWAKIVSKFEIDAMGHFGTKQRLSFHNVPELFSAMRTFCDFKTAADIGLPRPDLVMDENGERNPQTVIVEASPELGEIMLEVNDIAPKNFFKAMAMARKVAVDTRMLGVETDHEQKADHVAENVARIWAEHRDDVFTQSDGSEHPKPGGFQIIFCDYGVPGEKDFDAYSEIKRQLIARGMPAERIRFIHEAGDSKQARAAMFEAARNGEIDVLIGSTPRMGTGTNMQARAIALHHFDTPWRAADVQQREGRIIRQGNQYDEVEIYRYAVAGSFDAFMWGHVARKGRNWAGVLAGDPTIRTIDDLAEEVLSFDQIAALATGNPLILEHAEAAAEVSRLEQLAFAHNASQKRLHRRIGEQRAEATRLTDAITDTRAALPRRTATIRGEAFTATINGTVHTDYTGATDFIRGAALDLLAPDVGPGTTRTIGSFGGFDIIATTLSTGKKVHLSLAGVPGTGATYSADGIRSAGPLRTLANQLEGLEDAITEKLARIDQIEADINAAKARVGRAFDKAGDLDAARQRLDTIEEQMKPRPVDADFVEMSESDMALQDAHALGFAITGDPVGTPGTIIVASPSGQDAPDTTPQPANAVTAAAFPDPAPAPAATTSTVSTADSTPPPPDTAPRRVRTIAHSTAFIHLSYSWEQGVILCGAESGEFGGALAKRWGLNWSKPYQRWGMANTRRSPVNTAYVKGLADRLAKSYTVTADPELGLDLPTKASIDRPRLRLTVTDEEGIRLHGSTLADDANTVLQPLGLTYDGRYSDNPSPWIPRYGIGRDRDGKFDWPLIASILRQLRSRGFTVDTDEQPDQAGPTASAATTTGPLLVLRANDREGITISGTTPDDGARDIIRYGALRGEGLNWSRRNKYWYVRGSDASRGGWKPEQVDRIRAALEAGGFTIHVDADLPKPEPAPAPEEANATAPEAARTAAKPELRIFVRPDKLVTYHGDGDPETLTAMRRITGREIWGYTAVDLEAADSAEQRRKAAHPGWGRPLGEQVHQALGEAYQEHFTNRRVVLVAEGKEVYPPSREAISPVDTAFPSAAPSRGGTDLVDAAHAAASPPDTHPEPAAPEWDTKAESARER